MVIYDCKNMKQEFILKKNPDKTCSKKQKLHYGKFDSYIHQIWKMTFAMCILESGSTFDHSGVVQKDKSARWLQDDKTLVCTKSLYISSLQHKKHHHHLFWIFLALLTFWQTKNSIHLPMRKMWENLPVVWQKGPSSSLLVWQYTVRGSWPKQANHCNWDFDPRHWP